MQNYEIKIKSDGTWFHKGEKIITQVSEKLNGQIRQG